MGQGKISARDRRQGCANALRKIRCVIGHLRSPVDQGSSPQFIEWQRRVHPAGVVEVTIDETVEEMPDIEPADSAGRVWHVLLAYRRGVICTRQILRIV